MVTFYTFLHPERSKWVFNVHNFFFSGLVVRYFERKSTEGKYVTNKTEKV